METMPQTIVQNDDVQIFLKQYQFGTYLGLVPARFKTENKLETQLKKNYPLVLFLVFVILEVFSLKYKLETKKIYNITQDVIETNLWFVSFLFMAACLLCPMIFSKNWESFFGALKKIEDELDKTKFEVKRKFYPYILRIGLQQGVFLFIHICMNLRWYRVNNMDLIYASLSVQFMYYQFLVVIFIYDTTSLIKRRYEFLRTTLVDTVKGEKTLANGFPASEQDKIMKLTELSALHGLMHRMVKNLNRLYGWHIFLLLLGSGIMVLKTEIFMLQFFSANSNDLVLRLHLDVIAASVISGLTCAGYIVCIIMSCDKVEKIGSKITETSYLLQGGMQKCQLREELLCFAKYSEKISPKFTAAGFYQVNQGVLTATFSVLTTYLIICLQING